MSPCETTCRKCKVARIDRDEYDYGYRWCRACRDSDRDADTPLFIDLNGNLLSDGGRDDAGNNCNPGYNN